MYNSGEIGRQKLDGNPSKIKQIRMAQVWHGSVKGRRRPLKIGGGGIVLIVAQIIEIGYHTACMKHSTKIRGTGQK